MEITVAISSFLLHVKVEKGLSSNTISAYKRDLVKFDASEKRRSRAIVAMSSLDQANRRRASKMTLASMMSLGRWLRTAAVARAIDRVEAPTWLACHATER